MAFCKLQLSKLIPDLKFQGQIPNSVVDVVCPFKVIFPSWKLQLIILVFSEYFCLSEENKKGSGRGIKDYHLSLNSLKWIALSNLSLLTSVWIAKKLSQHLMNCGLDSRWSKYFQKPCIYNLFKENCVSLSLKWQIENQIFYLIALFYWFPYIIFLSNNEKTYYA